MDQELDPPAAAIAQGGDLGSLLHALNGREAKRDQLRAELAALGSGAHCDDRRPPAVRARRAPGSLTGRACCTGRSRRRGISSRSAGGSARSRRTTMRRGASTNSPARALSTGS
jgi:hypothetical protein